MTLRIIIKGDAIQFGENDFYTPCRTVDVEVPDDFLDIIHEHITGVEVLQCYKDQAEGEHK